MFRREWRQQALVLALLTVAVAATIVGLGVASNASQLKADPTFGTANTIITLHGSDSQLAADIAALQSRFGTVDVIAHQNIAVPGSVATIDLRAQNPDGPYGQATLRLNSGRYPVGADEVAVTREVATTFGLHVGSQWNENGRTRRVVGLVENPLNLLDQFALVAPGQVSRPSNVSILVNANQESLQSFHLPSAAPVISIEARGRQQGRGRGRRARAGHARTAVRRPDGGGRLHRHGPATTASARHARGDRCDRSAHSAGHAGQRRGSGSTAAVVGTAIGLIAWFAFVPTLQSIAEHRVDRFALPWLAIAVAMVLTFLTAVAAAWWPARAAARIPIVAALSGRPPRPQPAHRFAALGGVLLGAGIILLAFADQRRAGFIIGGTVATAVGPAVPGPAGHSGARRGRRTRDRLPSDWRCAIWPGTRLAPEPRSGAVTLAIGIAATIAISASAAQTPDVAGNLPTDQLMVYVTPPGPEARFLP